MGRSPRRLALIAALSLALAGLVFLAALLDAPSGEPPEACSDCTLWLGRFWEPVFVIWIIIANLFAWSIGMAAGALMHPWTQRQLRYLRR